MSEKKKILIVEDEAPAALALGDVLQGEGFEVITAHDGKEGLAAAITKHPDMILTDLKMPRMSGMDMIREIRRDVWGATVPVIVLSNAADGSIVQEAQEIGAVDYFIKGDMQMTEIIERIRRRLGA
jgi:DNA-binding response OmpR family regulator